MQPRHYAEIAALVFAAEAAFVVVHRLMHADYPGYLPAFSAAIDDGHALLWLAAATAAMLHRTSWALVLVMIAALESFVYGMFFSIASASGFGLPFVFVVAAPALVVAATRSLPAWRLHERSLARRRGLMATMPPSRTAPR